MDPIDINEFPAWVATAKPGDTVCYFRGFLMRDCDPTSEGDTAQARLVRRIVAKAEEDRDVCLTQRKVKADLYEYLATRRGARNAARHARDV